MMLVLMQLSRFFKYILYYILKLMVRVVVMGRHTSCNVWRVSYNL